LKQPGLFTRLWRSIKENPVGWLLVRNKTGRAEWAPRNYAGFAKEGYLENPYVYRAIQIRGAAIGGLRWIAVKKQGGPRGKRDEIENHPAIKLLKRPNPFQGQAQFFEALESFLLIAGNSYIAPSGPATGENAGKPMELWSLRPDRMQILPGAGRFSPIGGYEYRVDGAQPQTFGVGEILHIRKFHPLNDFYGMSPGYLDSYLDRVNGVTCAQVNAAIKKHLQAENIQYLVVTNAAEAPNMVEQIAVGGPAWGKPPADYQIDVKEVEGGKVYEVPETKLELLRRDAAWANYWLDIPRERIKIVPIEKMFVTAEMPE